MITDGNCLSVSNLLFQWPKTQTPCLHIKELRLASQELVFLRGASGSGKSTLLNLITGVIKPNAGTITLQGQDITALSPVKRDKLRASHIGYIFQQFNLLPYLSVIDNVLLPCRVSPERQARALQMDQNLNQLAIQQLTDLGLAEQLIHKPVTELSIGQQQRVAAARALIGAPALIVADEPTSALDTDHRKRFMDSLLGQCEKHHSSLLFVSHDTQLMPLFTHTLDMQQINEAAPDVLA